MGRPLVAIFTGAGISTDSGIPDYRGPRGVWTLHPEHEKLATIGYYMTDPEVRRRSWQMRRETYARAPQPNAAHRAIAELDSSGAVALRVITQNTDGLHQLAGLPARKVLELHGTSWCGSRSAWRCPACCASWRRPSREGHHRPAATSRPRWRSSSRSVSRSSSWSRARSTAASQSRR